jgi:hypothetical protein
VGQITIYLDNETEKRMLMVVKKSRLSKSKWIAKLIREKTNSMWPETVVGMAGAWRDFLEADALRKDLGRDAERESL